MRKTIVLALLLATVACGTSTPFTSQQELAALQGVWSGSATGAYSGTAVLTVNGSLGALQLPSNCPVTFNVPLSMAPGKTLAGSGFTGTGAYNGGYALSALAGTVNSPSQMTVTANFQTPCLASAVDAQFTLTKN